SFDTDSGTRTSLLTCWLSFSQVGLSQHHTAITHWVTTSNFIPTIRIYLDTSRKWLGGLASKKAALLPLLMPLK
ncbi:MAG: hypothetical protein ACNYWU_04065, partial [Desulfobacterales bacterium]